MSDSPEGIELEKSFGVKGHPTFIATNAKGDVVDWWVGYKDPATFAASTATALADSTTVEQKFIRLARTPSAGVAATLGRIKSARGQRAESLALYTRALELDPAGPYLYPIFEQTAALQGRDGSGLTLADVKAAADAALASPTGTPDNKVDLAMSMRRVAEREKDMKLIAPYVAAALEATKDVSSGWLVDARKDLLVDEALYVKGDGEAAAKLKRQAMPEGWMTDAGQLNEFAWWCFENNVNLADAETLARKGVELSKPGEERAQVLDTLAEILNLGKKSGEAVKLIEQAITEDPTEDHYKKQLERFRTVVASDM
jgi:tetratricopeptide (TPR) repeat protein